MFRLTLLFRGEPVELVAQPYHAADDDQRRRMQLRLLDQSGQARERPGYDALRAMRVVRRDL